jgi:hypothetical protein
MEEAAMQQTKGAILTVALIAGGLAGLGAWQFGNVGLGSGHGEGDEEDGVAAVWQDAAIAPVIERLVAEHGGRLVEVERERKDGRGVYELKLVAADGRREKLHVDAATGELIRR